MGFSGASSAGYASSAGSSYSASVAYSCTTASYASGAGSAGYASSAGSATNDSDGNAINSTYIKNAGTNPTKGDGTSIIQPYGDAPMSIRTTNSSCRDAGIFYMNQDACYVANSADSGYVFGVFDTDSVSDFSGSGTSSLCVLQDRAGTVIAGEASATQFTATSDKRLKENFSEIKNPDLSELKVYKYNFINDKDKKEKIGLIAQDVQNRYPQAVNTNEQGYLSLDYNAIVALLVGKVNEMDKVIQKQKEEIEYLKEKVDNT